WRALPCTTTRATRSCPSPTWFPPRRPANGLSGQRRPVSFAVISADPRQRLPEGEVQDAIAADRRSQENRTGVIGRPAADEGGGPAELMSSQRGEHLVGIRGGDEGDQLALVRHQERVESENLARSTHHVTHGNGALVDLDADAAA